MKAKLNRFTASQIQPEHANKQHAHVAPQQWQPPVLESAVAPQTAQEPTIAAIRTPVADSASAEIADIDSRLHALQSFLRAAKAGNAVPLTDS